MKPDKAIKVSRFALHTEYFSGSQIKGKEMGDACGTYERGEKCRKQKGKKYLEDLSAEGR
jgi:hypothetical protein